MPAFRAEILSIETPLPDTKLFVLKSEEPVGFTGGNWIMVDTGLETPEGKACKRAYSILSSDTDQNQLVIAVKKLPEGRASQYLHERKAGDILNFSGPYGKSLAYDKSFHEPLILASDTGITAALGLLNGMLFRGFNGQVRLLYFYDPENVFLPENEIRAQFPKELSVKADFVGVSPPEDVLRYQKIREILSKILVQKRPDAAFLAGDGLALRMAKEMLLVCGIFEENIRFEPFFNTDMKKVIPKDPAHLRTGYTTGACSAAAAKAAARAAVTGNNLERIETVLPNGDKASFYLKRCEVEGNSAVCSVVKDAGDDPDCTHLAELTARVVISESPEISIAGGEGIATVTKTGLGLAVGDPSITDMPMKNIREMVKEELKGKGAAVIISVPGGEEMSRQTTNERLGLVGGISILGTTGIVRPYSTAAFRRSIIQAMDVAFEAGIREAVVTTGGKTEQYAMKKFSELNEESFIQVGDFIGVSVRHAHKENFKSLRIFGMIGKLSKMADGIIQTHQKGSTVNMELLSGMALQAGADQKTADEILSANTARHVLDILKEAGLVTPFVRAMCRRIAGIMSLYAAGTKSEELKHIADDKLELYLKEPQKNLSHVQISCHCVDFDGTLLGEFSTGEIL